MFIKKHTSEIIYYLKGIAILSVLINHYLNNYVSGKQTGFANGFIALFFLIAGYLTYYSLEKSGKKKKFLGLTSNFFINRFLRVVPLYYLTLIIGALVFREQHSLMEYTTLQTKGLFWFVSALVHCYLLSPFLCYSLKKTKTVIFLPLLTFLFIISDYLYHLVVVPNFNLIRHVQKISALVYQDLFLSHVYLFAVGLAIASLARKKHKLIGSKNFNLYLLFLFILVCLSRTDFDNETTNMLTKYAFIFGASIIFYISTSIKTKLIFKNILMFLGKYSLSIYLFHPFFYKTLEGLNLMRENSLISFISTLLLLPIFLKLCEVIEERYSVVINRVKNRS